MQLDSNTDVVIITTKKYMNVLNYIRQHFILWTKYQITSVFPQLGWRYPSGDKHRLTALLGLKQKTQNFSAHSRTANITGFRTKKKKIWGNHLIDLTEYFFTHLRRRSGTTHLSCSSKVSQRQPLLLYRRAGNSSQVRGQTTENETLSKSWFGLRDGNWTLNMPAVKLPMDDQSWATNHNKGWEVKVLY